MAEEEILFPAARKFRELTALVEELISEHRELRAKFRCAMEKSMSAGDLTAFAKLLSRHIRREERQLFELLQQLVSAEELESLGQKLDGALERAVHACAMPNEKTRLRGMK